MNKDNIAFLDAYKALEGELKYEEKTVLDYENSLQGTEQEQLKVCRIMRNYLSHNDSTFIQATKEQIAFLTKLTEAIRRKSHTVKDELKRIKAIAPNETIANIIPIVDKYGIVPMETKDGYYLIDRTILLRHIANKKKKIELPKKLPKVNLTTKDTRIETLAKGIYVVEDKGKYVGLYIGE